MYVYIKGIVTKIENNYICLDNNGIGYLIYNSNPYDFKIDNEYKVYIYQHIREDENTLYGFKDIETKEMFLTLIGVKGLGCKTALPMLSSSIDNIMSAIEKEDIAYLKQFPKIGDKVARQIILDLKGKLVDNKINNNKELVDALKGLGYKVKDINKVLANIKEKKLEKQIKEALKLLLK